MNNQLIKASVISYYDDEMDHAIAEAIDHFAQHNIRFRTPNRNVGPAHKQKFFRPERKPE